PHSTTTYTYSLSLHDALPILSIIAIKLPVTLLTDRIYEASIPFLFKFSRTCLPDESFPTAPIINGFCCIFDIVTAWLAPFPPGRDRKSTRLNSSHVSISYAVF